MLPANKHAYDQNICLVSHAFFVLETWLKVRVSWKIYVNATNFNNISIGHIDHLSQSFRLAGKKGSASGFKSLQNSIVFDFYTVLGLSLHNPHTPKRPHGRENSTSLSFNKGLSTRWARCSDWWDVRSSALIFQTLLFIILALTGEYDTVLWTIGKFNRSRKIKI